MIAVVGCKDLGAGLQGAHRPLRQRGLHPAAGIVQALAATGVLGCRAIQSSCGQRCPVMRPAAPAAPTPALGCSACNDHFSASGTAD